MARKRGCLRNELSRALEDLIECSPVVERECTCAVVRVSALCGTWALVRRKASQF